MERIRVGKRKRKTATPFVYVSPEQRESQRELRKRKKLGIRHDPPVPADEMFVRCIRGIARAAENGAGWRRNLARYLDFVMQRHRSE